jgi:thermosome
MQPVLILKEGTTRERGKGALNNNIMAARAIADAVRTTLGPKGMDKMLVDSMGDVVITNDGVTILKEIDVEHPAAKMMVEVAKTQDAECYDGTTTAVVLAGALLKNAQDLIDQRVHPTVVTRGYRLAVEKAREILQKASMPVSMSDDQLLKQIAETAMSGKEIGPAKGYFADLALRAIKAIMTEEDGKLIADIDDVKVEKKQGGSLADTSLVEGIIIDKERVNPRMPRTIEQAKIALVNSALEIKKTEVDAKISIRDPTQLQAFLDEEEHMLRDMVTKVKEAGANVLLCQKGIDDLAQHYLAKEGVYAVRRVKKSDMEALAKATGGKIVTGLDELTPNDLGAAQQVEERKVEEDKMTFVTGCKNPKSVSVLVRGGTEHVVDEAERSFHDALGVLIVALEDGKAIAGGGALEVEVAQGLRRYATTTGGREQLAIEAFADAMDVIPRTLAENAGIDAINTLVSLRSAHGKGKRDAGLSLEGKVTSMLSEHVVEPLRVKAQAISSAAEAASMILRIDDVIASKAAPTPSGGGPPGGGYPGGEEY